MRRLRGRESHQPGGMSYAQYGLLFSLASETELPASRLAALEGFTDGELLTAAAVLDRIRAMFDAIDEDEPATPSPGAARRPKLC
ncbi:MAG: hypothetical protein ABI355_04325 [Solirubrobacteraceae bacterium]